MSCRDVMQSHLTRIAAINPHHSLGGEYGICYFPDAAYDRSGIELFEREVIPALS